MAKQRKHETDETIVNVDQVYSKSEAFFQENGKVLSIIGVLLIVVVGGYFAYTNLYLKPMEKEASAMMWKAEYYFETDSLEKAINGDGNYFGFQYIADEYGSTRAGNLAKYYLGISYMKQGEYEMAIGYLKSADLGDEMVASVALGTIGDAYVELEAYDQALSYFEQAIAHSDNQFTAPLYLMKKALLEENLGQYEEALESYRTIEQKYPESAEGRDIAKYIARAEVYAGSDE